MVELRCTAQDTVTLHLVHWFRCRESGSCPEAGLEDAGEIGTGCRFKFRCSSHVWIIFTVVKVGEDKVLAVTCLHLDHKLEPR